MTTTEDQLLATLLRRADALFADDDLYDDLHDQVVEAAIQHWTQKKRLSVEEADVFNDHYKVTRVFAKLNAVQVACKQLDLGIPFDALLARDKVQFENDIRNALQARKKKDSGAVVTTTVPVTDQTIQQVPQPNPVQEQHTEIPTSPPPPNRTLLEKIMDRYLSVEPRNVTRWWSFQLIIIALYLIDVVQPPHTHNALPDTSTTPQPDNVLYNQ